MAIGFEVAMSAHEQRIAATFALQYQGLPGPECAMPRPEDCRLVHLTARGLRAQSCEHTVESGDGGNRSAPFPDAYSI